MILEQSYWQGNGELQKEYNTLLKAENRNRFKFAKASNLVFYSYYRYYNDGEIPGWARGVRDYIAYHTNKYGKYELNLAGEMELERRVTERIALEWKRYDRKRRNKK